MNEYLSKNNHKGNCFEMKPVIWNIKKVRIAKMKVTEKPKGEVSHFLPTDYLRIKISLINEKYSCADHTSYNFNDFLTPVVTYCFLDGQI